MIWKLHWAILGNHSWAPTELHCQTGMPHVRPLCQGKSFPAPGENLVSQYCFQSHSLFLFFLLLFWCFVSGWVCTGHHFFWLSSEACLWLHGPTIWSLWVEDDRESGFRSMEDEKKSFLHIYLSWGFWHLLVISLCFVLFMHHYELKSLKKKNSVFPTRLQSSLWIVEQPTCVALCSIVYSWSSCYPATTYQWVLQMHAVVISISQVISLCVCKWILSFSCFMRVEELAFKMVYEIFMVDFPAY